MTEAYLILFEAIIYRNKNIFCEFMNSLIYQKKISKELEKKQNIFTLFYGIFLALKMLVIHMHERKLKDSFKKESCLGE